METNTQEHFQRLRDIAYQDLGIALEKAKCEIRDLKKEKEGLKAQLREVRDLLNKMNLDPVKKEEGFNWNKGE